MRFNFNGMRNAQCALGATMVLLALPLLAGAADFDNKKYIVRAAAPEGAIEHVMVIDMENENFAATFGPLSPAVYLNKVLLQQGQLVPNYFGTSHVSLGNYVAQISGQGTNPALNNDCLDLASLAKPPLVGGFFDVLPGTDAPDRVAHPGQVVGSGCVFPAPDKTRHGAQTIGDQLDRKYAHGREQEREAGREDRRRLTWRSYAEDMGDDLARDYGTVDPLGGASCAHPPINGVDHSNSAAANDQYATRHNPFVYFHSVIDNATRCNEHVVPLGKLKVGNETTPDVFAGHLYEDLQDRDTTPKFMFVTPNLCNDAHDATCAGPNAEGSKDAAGKNIGGLVAADLWLKHWMPMIFASRAYQSGKMLVVLTFDESGFTDARACAELDQSKCKSPTGPNVSNPGFSPILGLFKAQVPPTTTYQYAGGGQVGAVLFNRDRIEAGSVNTTGVYNHFSALRSYEDLLGLTEGGDDGLGHLGYAATMDLAPFGPDVFNR
jgi:hypothetical protein